MKAGSLKAIFMTCLFEGLELLHDQLLLVPLNQVLGTACFNYDSVILRFEDQALLGFLEVGRYDKQLF